MVGSLAPEDVVARVAAMQNWHDLEGASVVVFGDDDLMGIALAMSGLPREVVVLEIDLRIVERVKAFAAKHELATLHAHQYNLLEALPSEFQRRFDIFVTDPVESVEGLNITLSRAALSLKGAGSSGYFGLTTKEAGRNTWYATQGVLHEMGFVVTEIKDRQVACESFNAGHVMRAM